MNEPELYGQNQTPPGPLGTILRRRATKERAKERTIQVTDARGEPCPNATIAQDGSMPIASKH